MQIKSINLYVLLALLLFLIGGGFLTYKIKINSAIKQSPANTSLSVSENKASYTDMQGNEVSLSNRVGEVLIVISWASWSPNSADILNLVAETSQEFGVDVVAINRAENRFVAERYLKSISVNGKVELILDPDDNFYSSINGYAMPEIVIFDQSGEIVRQYRGTIEREDFFETLRSLTNKQ